MSKYSIIFIASCLAFVACNGCSDPEPTVPASDATVDVVVDASSSDSSASSEASVDASTSSHPCDATVSDVLVPGC